LLPSSKYIYGDSRKTKLRLLHKTRIHAPVGHFGNSRCSTIGQMPGDRTSLSFDASIAIPTHVLRFEASWCARIPSPPAEPPVVVLWFNQVTRPFVVNHRKPRMKTPVVSLYPAPAPVHNSVLLFLPQCGPYLTPLATGSLEPSVLVSPLLGGPARHRPFALALHLHQRKSSCNLHLQYWAKSQSTPCCQSLITTRGDHPLVLGRSSPQLVINKINTRLNIANWLAKKGFLMVETRNELRPASVRITSLFHHGVTP
jgi:hypothetical protein